METSERLELLKKKIREKTANNMVDEIQKLKSDIHDLKKLMIGDEEENIDMSEIVNLKNMLNEKFDNLIKKNTDIVDSIKNIKIETPNIPSMMKVSNLEEINKDLVKSVVEELSKLQKIINKKSEKQLVEVEGLDKSLEKIIPKDEMPKDVTMDLTNNDLWKKVTINYQNTSISVTIDRNRNDVIRKLTFNKE